MLKVGLVSIFPEMFEAISYGMTGRAQEIGALGVEVFNPRSYTTDNYRRVDDRPYGGGPGMVMMAEPLCQAIDAAKVSLERTPKVVYLSPQGRRLDYDYVQELVSGPDLVMLCGRYEGVDERVIDARVDEELSIGDYVLAGGELAAMVVIEAMARWLPGVLGNAESAPQDSFSNSLLDCRQYTRPEVWRDKAVPHVLLGGNHQAIEQWRQKDALDRTEHRRPDLLVRK